MDDIRCDKLSMAIATVRTHPDKCEKDFYTDVFFFTQYIDKQGPTPSVKIVSAAQTRPAKRHKNSIAHESFKRKIDLKKYCREEYDSMLMVL